MSDYDTLLKILEGKVKLKIYDEKDIEHYKSFISNAAKGFELQNSELENSELESGRHLGYGGFCSEWVFDRDGNFLAVGHYE